MQKHHLKRSGKKLKSQQQAIKANINSEKSAWFLFIFVQQRVKINLFLLCLYNGEKLYLHFNEEKNLTNNCNRLDKNLDKRRNAKPVD